jgi:hypothetical protein
MSVIEVLHLHASVSQASVAIAFMHAASHRLPPGVNTPCPLQLKLFRYAVDDLRLYQVGGA